MEAAPGDGAELIGVGGWEGGCCPPVIPLGMPPGPPMGPSLWGFGVPDLSSPDAKRELKREMVRTWINHMRVKI